MDRPPLIAVETLTATPAGAGEPVLRGVDLAVRAGERIVLTGPSGSGKSTLLRCMVLLEPAEGRVLLDGEPVDGSGADPARVRTLRRRVGYLPQRPVAIAGTLAENLAFPREVYRGALDEEAQRSLLARLALEPLDLTRRFSALSGGEQQRVALVRSLSARPDVLLLDEPTASLDPENVEGVVALLESWCAAGTGRALLWVSHQAHEVAELATRHVTLTELSR